MNQSIYAGVDVGGTNTKVGIVAENGEVIQSGKFATLPESPPTNCLENASTFIRKMLNDAGIDYSDLKAFGLATPGPMDIARGRVLTPFNLPGWRNVDVQNILANVTDRPVAFSNDASAAAFGEYWVGSGKQYDSIVLITLGTGVGGGIIVNDFSIDGTHSHGSEIGHMLVDSKEDARLCSCGSKGHLEAYASATGLVARCYEELGDGVQSTLQNQGDDNPISALMIFQAAEAGDEFANRLVTQTANYLGDAIVSLVHIIDPQAILLGGAMDFGGNESKTGKAFLKQIHDRARPNCLPLLAEKLTVEFANLGSDAGFIGAAGLARQLHKSTTPALPPA